MSASTAVSLAELESHLWEAANILRGPVDAADFKTYIFPLLFFKRICDVWDDEYQEIVDETGDEQLAWFTEAVAPTGFSQSTWARSIGASSPFG